MPEDTDRPLPLYLTWVEVQLPSGSVAYEARPGAGWLRCWVAPNGYGADHGFDCWVNSALAGRFPSALAGQLAGESYLRGVCDLALRELNGVGDAAPTDPTTGGLDA